MKFDYIDLGSYTSQYRQQALYNAGFAAYPMTGYDPGFLAMAFHFSKGPYSDPSRPTVYDKVIGQINSVYDREKRKQLFVELHQQIYDRAGEVYYFWDNSYSAHRTHVKNFTLQGDLFSACKEVWLDK